MKTFKKLFILCFVFMAFLVFVGSAQAATLSQTSVSLPPGQSSTVYASNVSTYLYLSANSNQSVATVSVSGNTILIYGSSAGNTTATICENSTNICNTIYITVTVYANVPGGYYGGGYGYTPTGTLSFNISNLTLSSGDSITVSSSGSGGIYASSNSNPSVVSISYPSLSSSPVSGCTGVGPYNIFTGQLCYSGGTGYGGSSYYSSFIPGCTGAGPYSTITGQLCYGGTNPVNNVSVTISALSKGSDTIILCQNGGSACSTIYISVIR